MQMSNNSIPSESFLKRIRFDTTKTIFVLFTILLVVTLVVFFQVLNHDQYVKGERLIARATLKTEVKELKNSIVLEVQNAMESSLLFNASNMEIDRFQTIYALKSTKTQFDNFKAKTLEFTYEDKEKGFQYLNTLLTDFNQQIVESINHDGQLLHILKNSQQDTDTISGEFLFDEAEVGMKLEKAKSLESTNGKILDQLMAIDNQISRIIRDEMEGIRSDSPVTLYVVFSVLVVLALIILGYLVIKNQNSSIVNLSNVLGYIAKGELPESKVEGDGGFEKIADASNQLVNYLDDASQFAEKIGDGNFGYQFNSKSKLDTLGNSLIEMRNRLQQVTEDDKIRNWVNEGQAKFVELLRQHNADIEDLGSHLIVDLVEYLNASQGALFVLKEEDSENYLELLSTYANKRKKYIDKKIQIGEGLMGQAFDEGKTIYMTDIKTDHYNIQTGLGESKPSCLLIVPLKDEDKIEGIIEIASLNELQKHQIEFVESIGESIASSLNSGKINQTTKKLLDETQQKAEEMKAQEEELRQNMEELAATQEQIERRNAELIEIQDKLSEEKYLLNALLNSTQDYIYFKDLDSKFIRVSNSMVKLFKKENESEIHGKSDFDFGFEEHAKVAFQEEQEIIRTAKPLIDAIEKEEWDDGHCTWVSTTKNPLRDLDNNIVGTFGISRDITSSKLNELDMNKGRDWLGNFFKYNPVGFVVFDQMGQINYVTESILPGIDSDNVKSIKFEDIFDDKEFVEFLKDIDFENTKDREVAVSLALKAKPNEEFNFKAISANKKNEDGTQNIFLIQQH